MKKKEMLKCQSCKVIFDHEKAEVIELGDYSYKYQGIKAVLCPFCEHLNYNDTVKEKLEFYFVEVE